MKEFNIKEPLYIFLYYVKKMSEFCKSVKLLDTILSVLICENVKKGKLYFYFILKAPFVLQIYFNFYWHPFASHVTGGARKGS